MPDFSVFLQLPTSIGSGIVSQWLSAESCAQLDIAYCNHESRSRYLELLANAEAVDFAVQSIFDQSLCSISWMVARKLKGNSLKLGDRSLTEFDEKIFTDYIYMSGRSLKTVIIRCGDIPVTTTVLRLVAANSDRCITSLNVLTCAGMFEDDQLEWRVSMQKILRNSAASLVHLSISAAVICMLESIRLPTLESMHVRECYDAQLLRVCSVAPNLRTIELEEPRCAGAALVAIAQHCPRLQSFECNKPVRGSLIDFDVGLSAIAKRCSKLTHLRLQECHTVTDVSIHAIATHCTQLQELAVSHNYSITDAPLIALARSANARTLQTVHIKWCKFLTGACVLELATHCTSLQTFRTWIWGDIVSHLKLAIPHLGGLITLDVGNLLVDDEVLQLIAEHIPCIEELDIGNDEDSGAAYTSVGVGAIAVRCEKLQLLNLCPSTEAASELVDMLFQRQYGSTCDLD